MSQPSLQREYEDWRLLRIYAWYRFLLSLMLIGVFALKPDAPMIGAMHRPLFLATALGYLITTASAVLFLRQPRNKISTYSFMLLLLDIVALALMTHATGSLNGQLSLLFLVVIAAGNILLAGKMGALIAAIAAIAILYEQFYLALSVSDDILTPATLAQTSIIGISFFVIALFSQIIVHRMREGEALAASHARNLADLQRLNEQVIRRMRTGIIAVDNQGNTLLSNDSARQLLGLAQAIPLLSPLTTFSPLLDAAFYTWQINPQIRPTPFRNRTTAPEVSVSFAQLNPSQTDSPVLLFIEDMTQLAQQAQQLKLASLGRLAASISHEIRNPLGAISHATQLLAESEVIESADRRLLEIITQHCQRMNGIVENVLSVSRRQPSSPQTFSISEWLHDFHRDYLTTVEASTTLDIPAISPAMMVRFDPPQLYQVVSNLVTNGLRYSRKKTGKAIVYFECGTLPTNGQTYLDVIDVGEGLSAEQQAHLFEPFFTTENTGTGLGLYLSREICEANQARLDYLPREKGACFRITFAHSPKLN